MNTGTQAGLMNIVSMIQHRDKAPTNALMAQAIRSCADRGISNLWYANMSYGKKQLESALADFKRHNGFQKVDLPRYYVPLTVVGRVALRLSLHHNAVLIGFPSLWLAPIGKSALFGTQENSPRQRGCLAVRRTEFPTTNFGVSIVSTYVQRQ